VIQLVVHLREGPTRQVKDVLAAELTEVVRRLLSEQGPIEVWFREYGPARVYLGGEEV
jgi:phenylpyruvate tautomerase PptA (4-oxalocrotonate tautomerase family)